MSAVEQPSGSLVLHEVEAGYPGSTFALAPMSFEVGQGEVVGIIGPNGSGKSTLLKAIARVLPLHGGRITLGSRPIEDYRGRLAFVPQREDVKWDFPADALDVVLMARYREVGWLRRPSKRDRQIAVEALARMGLGGMEHNHISEFSGGQQQRIFLARAIAQEPSVILLDEPFTGVDAENRAVLHEVIQGFARRGAIVLVATHDLDEVQEMTSSLACINRRLVAYGRTEDTFTPDNLRATFGGQVAVFA